MTACSPRGGFDRDLAAAPTSAWWPRAGALSTAAHVHLHHSFLEPGLWWESATHSKEESISRVKTSASYQQQEWPRGGWTSSISAAFSSCSLPWMRKQTVHKVQLLGYMSQFYTASKDNVPSAAKSP